MKRKTYRYQNEYENTVGLFWENSPASFVKLFANIVMVDYHELKVLDLGAGEGKNSVFFASKGAKVVAVDTSENALSKFTLQPNFIESEHRIYRIQEDILELSFPNESFDIIIAYGVLHCMNSYEEIVEMIKKIQLWLKKGGYFIGATFNNEIGIPDIQDYLCEESLLEKGQFETFFHGWDIIAKEDGIISETHCTTLISHKHSISRLIAKK